MGGVTNWYALFICVTALICFASLVISATIIMGASNGRHRKSTAQIHGSTDYGTDPSPGGTSPRGSTLANPWQPQPGSLGNAFTYVTRAQLAASRAHATQLMAHPSMSPPPALGSGLRWTSAQKQQMQAQLQAAWMQSQLQHQQAAVTQMHGLMGTSVNAALSPPPPHPQTALKSEGIRAGEIIAWRAWRIIGETLLSATAVVEWSPDEPMRGDAAAGFGIHAYKSPHGPMLDGYADVHQQGAWVIGEVALWGDVIEHERGYRAEYGRVHSLVTWSRAVDQRACELIMNRYLQCRLGKPT